MMIYVSPYRILCSQSLVPYPSPWFPLHILNTGFAPVLHAQGNSPVAKFVMLEAKQRTGKSITSLILLMNKNGCCRYPMIPPGDANLCAMKRQVIHKRLSILGLCEKSTSEIRKKKDRIITLRLSRQLPRLNDQILILTRFSSLMVALFDK